MGINDITRRLAAWTACVAILFAALAPSISQAVSLSKGDTWTEICSVAGIKLIKVSSDQAIPSDLATQDSSHFKHCPFCSTHPATLALLPTAGFALPSLAIRDTYPPLFFQSPRPLQVWAAAQSRGPPSQA
jgi:hypothetical protein